MPLSLSGSFTNYFQGNASRFHITTRWSATQNIANNTSTITATTSIKPEGAVSSSANKVGSITIAGNRKSFNFTIGSMSAHQSKVVDTHTVTVTHNSNGTGSASIASTLDLAITYSGKYMGSLSTSGTASLDTIPRASSIGIINGNQIGSAITINITRASTSFTHKVWIRYPGGSWELLTSSAGTSATFTSPLSACSYYPNSTSGNLEVSIQTMSGSTNIGSALYKNHTVNVPTSVVPKFSSLSVSEAVASVASLVGAYVQSKSKVKVTINSPVGIYGSTISSYRIELPGTDTTVASSITSNFISSSGNLTVKGTVYDSRGRSFSRTVTISVLSYHDPKIENVKFERANNAGVIDPYGTFVKVSFKTTVASLINGTQKNKMNYKVLTKRFDSVSFDTKTDVNSTSLTYTGSVLLSGYDVSYSYNSTVRATDIFGSSSIVGIIALGVVLMQWHKDSMSIGTMMQNTNYNLLIGAKGLKSQGIIEDRFGNEVFGFGGTLVEIDE